MPSFLAPLFLIGALAAAVPVVLHLLKRHPETRVKFAAVRLLRNAPVEMTRRRRLRELLLLALRVTALVLLALAFARPFLAGETSTVADGVTVVAIDASLSLSAPGQFERARQLAREAIDAAPASHLVGVITFSGSAEVLAAPTSDRGVAMSAIDRASAGLGTTRYRAALGSALPMIQEHASGGRIVVVTDLGANGWRASDQVAVPESVTVDVADVGAPPGNVAVTQVQADRDAVIATVRNASSAARAVPVRVTIDGREGASSTITLEPNGEAAVTLAAARGDEAVVSIVDVEGIAADNTRYVLLARDASGAFAVLTPRGDLAREALYVEQALVAGRGPGSNAPVEGIALSSLAGLSVDRLHRYKAAVLLSTRGLDRRGRDLLHEFVMSGGGLLLPIGPDVDAQMAAELVGGDVTVEAQSVAVRRAEPVDRRLAPADARHPIFRAFTESSATLASATFQRVATVRAEGCATLARFTTGEDALLDCERGRGRLLVFASDLGRVWNDLPRQAPFVAFLNEAIAYLANDAQGAAREFLIDDRPAGVAPEPGFATRPSVVPGAAGQRVAINVDPEEAASSRLTPDAFRAAIVPAAVSDGDQSSGGAAREEARQQLWWYLVLAMLVVLAAEGWVGARVA